MHRCKSSGCTPCEQAFRLEARHPLVENPPVLAVVALQPVFHLELLSRVKGVEINIHAPLQVVRMHSLRTSLPPRSAAPPCRESTGTRRRGVAAGIPSGTPFARERS